ncbi:class I SAM-dependent methyltransferase [Numidum massiliense]|uniref:class I SAM-dependent methyltransferase n=1 Tax=Numidum massiliense TaxID=1522315 RepID=UPI0006D56D25|nr:SAM-dependent methyltransferase [Numidum massiliense]
MTTATPLAKWIRAQLQNRASKRVTFAQFMAWTLYHPTLGYYTRPVTKIGRKGDFFTNSSVSTVFGETLAPFLQKLSKTFASDSWAILEVGGGDGKLASDLLRALPVRGTLPREGEQLAPDALQGQKTFPPQRCAKPLQTYYMLEASPYHRARVRERVGSDARLHFIEKLDELDAVDTFTRQEPVIVLANELFDALPVHRLRYSDGKWQEIYVAWDGRTDAFTECLDDVSVSRLAQYVREEQPPERQGQTIEVNLEAERMLQRLAAVIPRGYLLTIDYGDVSDTLWEPARRDGTLRCYYRHGAHDDPYVRVGEQDLTAHVNFTSLQRWGGACGWETQLFAPQGEFLQQIGILQQLVAHSDPNPFSAASKRNRAIRQLIAPGGMGSTFNVLLQARGNGAADVQAKTMSSM